MAEIFRILVQTLGYEAAEALLRRVTTGGTSRAAYPPGGTPRDPLEGDPYVEECEIDRRCRW